MCIRRVSRKIAFAIVGPVVLPDQCDDEDTIVGAGDVFQAGVLVALERLAHVS